MIASEIGKKLLLLAACLTTMSRAQFPITTPQFDVVSVKRNLGAGNLTHIQPLPGGRLVVENFPLRFLIQTAYGVQPFQISGDPDWMNTDRYDIQAKAEGDPSGKEMTGPMLRALLEDRFRLRLHHETRLLPAFELAVAKGGPKMHHAKEGGCIPFSMNSPPMPPMRAPGDARPTYCGFLGFGGDGLTRKLDMAGATVAELVSSLSRQLQKVVIDKTGLGGAFDINLHWMLDVPQTGPGASGDAASQSATNLTGPSIFTAIEEQLGLKLQSAKGPVNVLVIDHVERPSRN